MLVVPEASKNTANGATPLTLLALILVSMPLQLPVHLPHTLGTAPPAPPAAPTPPEAPTPPAAPTPPEAPTPPAPPKADATRARRSTGALAPRTVRVTVAATAGGNRHCNRDRDGYGPTKQVGTAENFG